MTHLKFVSLICLVAVALVAATGFWEGLGPSHIAMFALLAPYDMGHPAFMSNAFTVWVFAFVTASMVYSAASIWGARLRVPNVGLPSIARQFGPLLNSSNLHHISGSGETPAKIARHKTPGTLVS